MERITRWPGSRAAEYARDHPGVAIPPPVDGTWHAEVVLDCGYGYMHEDSEDELIKRLTKALG